MAAPEIGRPRRGPNPAQALRRALVTLDGLCFRLKFLDVAEIAPLARRRYASAIARKIRSLDTLNRKLRRTQ